MRSLRLAAPAILAAATLALSACSGGGTTPSVPGSGLNGVSGAMHSATKAERLAVAFTPMRSARATSFPSDCFPYSIANGLDDHLVRRHRVGSVLANRPDHELGRRRQCC